MSETLLISPLETEKLRQNAFRVSLITAVFLTILAVVFQLFVDEPDITVSLSATVQTGIVALAAWLSVFLAHRNRHVLGIWLLLGTLYLINLRAVFTTEGSSIIIVGMMLVMTTGLATLTLRRQNLNWAMIVSMIVAVAMILVDLFGPANREVTTTASSTAVAAIPVFIIYGFFVARQFQNFSLRAKLVTAFVGISILLVVGISFITTRTVTEALTQEVGENFQVQAQSLRSEVNLFFHEKVSQMQALALVDGIKEQTESRNNSYTGTNEQILAEIQSLDEQWIAAADDDPFILEIITPDEESNPAGFQLKDYLEAFPFHSEIFITDRYGATIAATGRLSDYYQADEAWWQAAWNDGQGAVYISDPEFDESAGVNALLIAVPIYSEEESTEVLGIVRSTLIVDALYTEVVDVLRIGETGHAILLSADGEVIYDPRAVDGSGSADLPAELRQDFVTQASHFDVAANENGEDAIFGHALLHVPEDIDTTRDDLQTQIGAAILDLGWAAVVRQEGEEAFAAVDNISRTIQLASIVAIGLAAVLAALFARYIAAPIQRLNLATQAVGASNLNVALPHGSEDEVGQLISNFSRMVERLKNTLGSLQARTQDLDLAVEVGRDLSRVRDLESTLNDAVETIRNRFNLYYAQIYLTDPTRRSLILRAGTGEVGRKLIQRGHRLLVGPGSINGAAASSQEAVVVTNTEESQGHRTNPLLPDTRSEMAIPLIADGKLVGVLDLQSDEVGGLSEENVPGFTALSAQLAVAIQNAALFSETQQARAEVEAYTERLSRQNWEGYLNGIDRSQYLAAAYDLSHEAPLHTLPEPKPEEIEFSLPITVAGASVGAIRLTDYENRGWSSEETEMLTAVADKVANHIDNLRLLSEAEKYRLEAENVVRRLTREGWQSYQETAELSASSFIYEHQAVQPLHEEIEETPISHSFGVRGESVGNIDLYGISELDTESKGLIHSVSDKIANRLEAIRLSHQIERSLVETEEQARRLAILNELGKELSQAVTADDAFKYVAAKTGNIVPSDRASIALINDNKNEFEVFALDGIEGILPTGARLPINNTLVGQAIKEQRLINTREPYKSSGADAQALSEQGMQSIMNAPLIASGEVIGTINVASQKQGVYDNQEENLLVQIASLLATTLESRRLGERATLLASIVENHPDFIGIGSLEGQAIYVNPAGLRMMDLPADHDVTVMDATHFYLPEDAQLLAEEGIPTAMETGVWNSEVQLVKTDGSLIPVEETVGINYDASKNPVSFSITMRDISERKEAEQQLATSFSLLETTLESTADGILVADGKGGIVRFNQKFVEMWQVPEEIIASRDDNQAIGHVLSQLVDPDQFVSKVQELYNDLEATSSDILHFKDGRVFERYSQPQRLGKDIIGRVWSFRDVTERELHEAELAEQARRLVVLNELGKELSLVATAEDAFKTVALKTAEIITSDRASIALLNDSKNEFEVFALDGIKGILPTGAKLPATNTLLGLAATEQRLVNTVEPHKSTALDAQSLSKQGVQSIMNAPLIASGEVFGTINVASLTSEAFDSREENLLIQIASLLATTIENRRLFSEAQTLADQEQIINSITQKIQQTRSVKGALQVAIQELGQAFQAKQTAVHMELFEDKQTSVNGH